MFSKWELSQVEEAGLFAFALITLPSQVNVGACHLTIILVTYGATVDLKRWQGFMGSGHGIYLIIRV